MSAREDFDPVPAKLILLINWWRHMGIGPIPLKLLLFNIKYMYRCNGLVKVIEKLKVFDSDFFALNRT
jgi:hypothetical protein